jgi:hypothetical protein
MRDRSVANEIKVAYVVSGASVDPTEVTTVTDIQPSAAWRIGDVRNARTGATRADNGWQVTSRLPTTASVAEQVNDLLAMLALHKTYLAALAETAQALFSVVIYVNGSVPEISLEKTSIRGIAELNAEMDVDLYCLHVEAEGRLRRH